MYETSYMFSCSKNCCKECNKRVMGCHSKCENYNKMKKNNDELHNMTRNFYQNNLKKKIKGFNFEIEDEMPKKKIS